MKDGFLKTNSTKYSTDRLKQNNEPPLNRFYSNRPIGGFVFNRASICQSFLADFDEEHIPSVDTNKKGGMLLPPFLPQIYQNLTY